MIIILIIILITTGMVTFRGSNLAWRRWNGRFVQYLRIKGQGQKDFVGLPQTPSHGFGPIHQGRLQLSIQFSSLSGFHRYDFWDVVRRRQVGGDVVGTGRHVEPTGVEGQFQNVRQQRTVHKGL